MRPCATYVSERTAVVPGTMVNRYLARDPVAFIADAISSVLRRPKLTNIHGTMKAMGRYVIK